MRLAAHFGCAVLALVVLFPVVEGWYFPQYRRRGFDVSPASHDGVRLMSANVRCWSPTDLGCRSWFYRAPLVLRNIAGEQPDVMGFQVVTRVHYAYLTQHLKGYASVLAYRDGSFLSEGCPIFYNTQKFSCTDSGSFWLSETPDVCSRDWGAAFPRICSFVLLRENESGKMLAVFNTHLDHVSETARIRGVGVVLEKLREFGDMPCVLMGDLNAREESETYRAATELFDDAKYRTENPPKGPTFQKWGQRPDAENIDYFLISETGIDVQSYKIVTTLYDGVYPSDHFPIAMQIRLV